MVLTTDPRTDALHAAEADLEAAIASLAGYHANCRAAGLPRLADSVPSILSLLRTNRLALEIEGLEEELGGEPPADWYLSN